MAHAGLDYTDPAGNGGSQDPVSGEPLSPAWGEPLRLQVRGANRERLDRYLSTALDEATDARIPAALSRSRIQRWIAIGAVRVDGRLVLASHRLRGLEEIEVWPQPLESEQAFRPEAIPLEVVHADADVAVIDKPAGLVTHPAPGHWQGTLMNGLLHRFPATRDLPRAGIVHRLDRDTSGLLACALSERGFAALGRQLADRSMKRSYLAVMPSPPQPTGSIEAAIGRDPRDRLRMAVLPAGQAGAKPARTDWEVLAESGSGLALVLCRLHTGRTHQIRVHFASIGCALVGDPLYAGRAGNLDGPVASPIRRTSVRGLPAVARPAFPRQALHAWRLRFDHPGSGVPLALEAPLPADMQALLDAVGLSLPAGVASTDPASGPASS